MWFAVACAVLWTTLWCGWSIWRAGGFEKTPIGKFIIDKFGEW